MLICGRTKAWATSFEQGALYQWFSIAVNDNVAPKRYFYNGQWNLVPPYEY